MEACVSWTSIMGYESADSLIRCETVAMSLTAASAATGVGMFFRSISSSL
jgi:hypothetical protein